MNVPVTPSPNFRKQIITISTTIVIIPALNEQASIAQVVRSLPSFVSEIIVVDNGSNDRTTDAARSAI
jgi:cellulose synthase/poly-beta-1,6-N-acetylglucosamine synthase-like glycosyltransferase